jgi:hypothetical protein
MEQRKLDTILYAVIAAAVSAALFFWIGHNAGFVNGYAVGRREAQQSSTSTADLPHLIALRAPLAGYNSVPTVNTGASGQLDLSYDTKTRQLSWKGTYRGLRGPVTGAAIFGPAQPGQNAAVQFELIPFTSPFAGSTRLSEAQEYYLLTGSLYISVKSRAFTNGEIRGQILRVR